MDEYPGCCQPADWSKDWLRLWTMLEQFPVTWVPNSCFFFKRLSGAPHRMQTAFSLIKWLTFSQPRCRIHRAFFLLQPPASLKNRGSRAWPHQRYSFSPSKPLLALAGGNRCTALWDYSKAAMEQRIREFGPCHRLCGVHPSATCFVRKRV